MKTGSKILSLLFISLIAFSSCSKDDDPADNDLFLGKYEGSVGYNGPDDGDGVSESNGSATVTKVGNNYTFNFSDGIPAFGDIVMEKGDNSTLGFDDGESGTISTTESSLTIAQAGDGRVWSANRSTSDVGQKKKSFVDWLLFVNPRVLIPPVPILQSFITKKALILRLKLLRKGRDWFSPACPMHYPEPSSNRPRGFSSLQLNFSKSSII